MVTFREAVEVQPYAEVAVKLIVRVMGRVVLFTYVWAGAKPASTTPSPMFHDQLAAPVLLLTNAKTAGEHMTVSTKKAAVTVGYTVTWVVAVSVHPDPLLATRATSNVDGSVPEFVNVWETLPGPVFNVEPSP